MIFSDYRMLCGRDMSSGVQYSRERLCQDCRKELLRLIKESKEKAKNDRQVS